MPRKLTVVLSQGQSADPAKRGLEEGIVAALLMEKGIEVTVIQHLYDLRPDGTSMLCLKGITGDMVVLSWLYPRAAHWVLDRNGVKGREGKTLLGPPDDNEDDGDEAGGAFTEGAGGENGQPRGLGGRDVPGRFITCLDLRWYRTPEPYVSEIRRMAAEAAMEMVSLGGLFGGMVVGNGNAEPLAAKTEPAPAAEPKPPVLPIVAGGNGQPAAETAQRVQEQPQRRWYPVVDYSRCTNCMECLDFCLFGVYGVDKFQTILVEQPDNCRKGCPACSRVCPEHAIIFPQHKSPEIAGAPEGAAGGFKIDLSKLFGGSDPLQTAVQERDAELVAAGRQAVGTTVGIPKRRKDRPAQPKDDLDKLLDQLDDLGL